MLVNAKTLQVVTDEDGFVAAARQLSASTAIKRETITHGDDLNPATVWDQILVLARQQERRNER